MYIYIYLYMGKNIIYIYICICICIWMFHLLKSIHQNMNSTGTKCYPLNVTTTDSLRTYDFLMISIIDTLVSTLSNAPLACLCSSRNPPQQRVTKPKFLSRGHQAILTAILVFEHGVRSGKFRAKNSE